MLKAGRPSRVLVFDATCHRFGVGLSSAWWAGSLLYRSMGRFDHVFAAHRWQDALSWLSKFERPIDEIQFWGHGRWGRAFIGGEALAVASLSPQHPHRALLEAVREGLSPNALWWFRTCETFGARAGHEFAREWSQFFGCRAAGHTHIIGFWQSGLHALAPGQAPDWSEAEGLAAGTPAAPAQAKWSRPWYPNTVSCLHGRLPSAG